MLPTVVAREVHDSLVDYLRTTFRLRNAELERALFTFLESADKGLFRGPYLDVRLPFRTGNGDGGESCLAILPRDYKTRPPYAHQLRAWERLSSADGRTPQPTLVTTGTGSGKTECFVYPLLDHCLRARQRGEQGIKAIVLYPMNALATDQAVRFARQIAEDPRLTGTVSAGLYVGGPGTHGASGTDFVIDQRAVLRESPPDILLTNYRMLDFLLMRPEDKKLWRFNEPDTLRYIVLDELHTYDGAQGSDVACLLRRLKARLSADVGSLCAVGTSATIGGEAAAAELRRFAGELFEMQFEPDAIVGEDRKTLAETFPAPDELVAEVRDPWSALRGSELVAALRRGEDGSSEEHVAAQLPLWLPGCSSDPEAVAKGLANHVFLRRLLEALAGRSGEKGPKSLASVIQQLSQGDSEFANLDDDTKSLALSSFITLLSYARRDGRPFLDVQVQIWIKELRGLVMKLQTGRYEFAWRDELGYCRECGIDGIGAIVREGHDALRVESRAVGEAYLKRKRQARFLRLNVSSRARDVAAHERTTICPACLVLDGQGEPCKQHAEPVPRIPIVLVHRESPETRRFLPHCPACDAEYALTMLGGRISSLSSVVVGRLFQSRHQDALPKLLAFTDSVQDASHRAGFFGGRTFRFNLRSAIAGALDAVGGEAELEGFAERVIAHHARVDGEARTIAAFLPSDLRELDEAVAFHAAGEEGVASIPPAQVAAMRAVVLKRLSWEITREFGYGVHVGHSLEVSGIATLEFDRDRVAEATDYALSALREESGLGLVDTEVSTTEVRHFIEGLCTRMRFRGGICHELLDRYMQSGKRYMLSKRMNPVLSPFGRDSVLPRFLYRGQAHDIFDALFSKPSARGYIRDWVTRSLRVSITDSAIDRFLERVMALLVSTGLVRAVESEGSVVYGLEPSALRITSRVRRVRCDVCTRTVLLPEATAAHWANQRCDRYKCLGYFSLDDAPGEPDYYEKLFRTGRVQRIFAREHTGLLAREVREPLERAFKEDDLAKRAPDAPNLLTCTPAARN
jgi:DEAD/DEAH box helicase domain-containing protein